MKQLKISLVMLLGFAQLAIAQQDPKAKEILDKMSAKYQAIPAFSANFVQTLENKMENMSDSFEGSIIVRGEKYYADLGAQIVINDGKTVWIYIQESNEVTIDHYYPESGDMNPTKIYTAYQEGFKYRYMAGEGAAKYHVIELDPEDKESPFFKVRMSVRKTDNLLEKWSVFDRTGNVYHYEVKDFKERTDIKDNFFKFDAAKYPGVEILDFR